MEAESAVARGHRKRAYDTLDSLAEECKRFIQMCRDGGEHVEVTDLAVEQLRDAYYSVRRAIWKLRVG